MYKKKSIIFLSFILLAIPCFILNSKNKEEQPNEQIKQVEQEEVIEDVEIATISRPIIDLQITLTPEIKEPIDYESEYNKELDLIDNSNEQEWFVSYKLLQDEYSEHIEKDKTIYDEFSANQIKYMQRCIETEVYQAPFDSKCNVASVILNRVYNNRWSSNPITVVTSKNQFAYSRTNITESTILALEYAYQIGDTTNGCIAFRSGNKPNSWIGLKLQFVDGVGHGFYK